MFGEREALIFSKVLWRGNVPTLHILSWGSSTSCWSLDQSRAPLVLVRAESHHCYTAERDVGWKMCPVAPRPFLAICYHQVSFQLVRRLFHFFTDLQFVIPFQREWKSRSWWNIFESEKGNLIFNEKLPKQMCNCDKRKNKIIHTWYK